jgi:hypothetical protein
LDNLKELINRDQSKINEISEIKQTITNISTELKRFVKDYVTYQKKVDNQVIENKDTNQKILRFQKSLLNFETEYNQLKQNTVDILKDINEIKKRFKREKEIIVRKTNKLSRDLIYIQVGLDFGTSSTKAVFYEIGARRREYKVIDFNHNLND